MIGFFAVVLTNQINDRPLVVESGQYFETLSTKGPEAAQGLLGQLPLVAQFLQSAGDPQAAVAALAARVADLSAEAFAHTFWVAAILLSTTLVAAFFLPRKHEESHLLDDVEGEDVPPVLVH